MNASGSSIYQTPESYLPTPEADGSIDPASLPTTLLGYLIRVKPRLRLDDQEVASGAALVLGDEFYGTYSMSRLSGGWFDSNNTLVAGAARLFGLDLQGISQAELTKESERTGTGVLHEAAMAYFAEHDAYLDTLNDLGLAYTYRHPSFGTFSTVVTPAYRYGIPHRVTFSGVQLDLDMVMQTVVPADPNRRVEINRSIGLKLSALEHEIPESYLADATGNAQGVSAVKALALAVAAGQRLYTVTAENVAAVLGQLQQSDRIEQDVQNAANAGKTVLISQSSVSVGGWRGAGYIVEDPQTGNGAYLLSGGANGGELYDGQSEVALALAWAGIPIANVAIPPTKADDEPCEQQWVRVPLADKIAYAALLMGLAALIAAQPETAGLAGTRMGVLIGYFVNVNRASQRTCEIPILIVGSTVNSGTEITEVRDHIAGALGGKSPKFLTYMGPGITHPRRWLQDGSTTECNRDAREAYTATHGMAIPDCDEYPFSSVYQGGQYNYLPPNRWVSLQLVRATHNRAHGQALRWFYERCRVPKNGDFEVRTDSGVTRGVNSQGVQCYP